MDLITLRNKSRSPQQVFVSNRMYTIDVGEEKSFTKEVASAFSNECGPLVDAVYTDSIGGVYQDKRQATTMWVANITGNPDAPEFVYRNKVTDMKTGYVEKVSYPNPIRQAFDIKAKMHGSEIQYAGPHGDPESRMSPAILFEVPAFNRCELPIAYAKWLLNRDRVSDFINRGRLMKSRAPWVFEPTMDWSLEEMQVYLSLCDAKAKLGEREPDLKARVDRNDFDRELFDAKRFMMKRLFFRIANPDVKLPTKQMFEDFRRGGALPQEPKVSQSQAAQLLAKAKAMPGMATGTIARPGDGA